MNWQEIENNAIIMRLPSGFYAVWIGGDWINASLPNENAAIEWLKQFIKGGIIQ